MSNGRIYSIQFDANAETAVHDVFEIVAASDRMVEILSFHLSQITVTGDASEELLLVQYKSGQTTTGSGGAAVTPVPRLLDDVASGATCAYANTTQATGGTIVTHFATYWNVRMPLDIWLPPEQTLWLRPSQRGTWSIDTTPAASTTMTATCTFREVG
jgi:hypothetical protein